MDDWNGSGPDLRLLTEEPGGVNSPARAFGGVGGLSQAMEQAGIRPSQRHRKVSDYMLERLVDEGPGYQDWEAVHAQVPDSRRRVRLYLVRMGATAEDRQTIERAALREFQLLETLQHPGVLRVYSFTEHELGPALIFEHDPQSIRLDHYLAQQKDRLSRCVNRHDGTCTPSGTRPP